MSREPAIEHYWLQLDEFEFEVEARYYPGYPDSSDGPGSEPWVDIRRVLIGGKELATDRWFHDEAEQRLYDAVMDAAEGKIKHEREEAAIDAYIARAA